MKLRDLTADHLGKGVKLEARHIDVVGTLEAYSHQSGKFAASHQMSAVRSSVETSVTIAGHAFDFHELLDAKIEVLP